MKRTFNYINRCIRRGSRKVKLRVKYHKMRVPSNIPDVVVALTYSQIYDDYLTTNPKDFLKGIPTFYSLQYILQLKCDVHYTLHNPKEDRKHICTFSKICNDKEKIRLQSCIKRHGNNLMLINPEGSMRFVRLALSCFTPEDKSFRITQEKIKCIFMAYLYCNQLWTNEQISNRTFAFNNIVDASLRIDLPFSEFKYFKDFRTQMYKSIRYFQHAEKEPTLRVVLNYFCQDRNVQDWKEYIRILFGFFQASMKTPVVNMKTAPKQAVDFMTPFIIEPSMLPLEESLTGHLPDMLRDKFLLRSSEDSSFVLILSSDLLVDKIYQGLKFDFANTASENNIRSSSGKTLSQVTINSMLGADFSEYQILYPLLDVIYSTGDEYFRKPGKDIKDFFSEKNGQSEPDYYLRKGNKLMLIENKDVLFPIEIKFSKHLHSIKQSISNKIASFGKYPNPKKLDHRGKPKVVDRKEGLGQLYYNIYRLAFKKELYRAFDSEVDNVDIIYPVLVTYDNAYSALGVNAYACKKISGIRKRIRKRYLKMYGTEPNLSSYKIQKPVIVDIDTLIMYSLKLRRKELELFDLIDEYNGLVDKYDDNLSSFSTFMVDYHKLQAQGEDFIKLLYGDILES